MACTVKSLPSERAGHRQAEGLQAASVSIDVTAASATQQRTAGKSCHARNTLDFELSFGL